MMKSHGGWRLSNDGAGVPGMARAPGLNPKPRGSGIAFVACVAGGLLAAGAAHADGHGHSAPRAAVQPDESPHAKAASLFATARKHVDSHDCSGALPLLLMSLQSEPTVDAELALADCSEPKDPLEAWRQVVEAERVATKSQDPRLGTITARAAALAAKLPTLRIVLAMSHARPGLEVRVDGTPVDSFVYRRGPMATTPGLHTVVASDGALRWSSSVETEVGKPVSVTVFLQPKAAAPAVEAAEPPPPPPPPLPPGAFHEDSYTRRDVGWTIGAVGLAGLATAAIATVIATSAKSAVANACRGPSGTGGFSDCMAAPGSQASGISTTNTWTTISTAAFLGGAALVVTGATISLTGKARPAASASLVLAPYAGPNAAGGIVAGSW
jgi:hypothetical protein